MKHQATIRLVTVLGGIVLVAFLLTNYSKDLTSAPPEGLEVMKDSLGVSGPLSDGGPFGSSSHSAGGNAQPSETLQSKKAPLTNAYTETHLQSSELLPKGQLGASWSAVNPASSGDIQGQNFLDAGSHTNTAIAGISQSNKNASWDIRSETPNPRANVGPWLQSTIEANPFKRGLED
jgi:hypothetical protein